MERLGVPVGRTFKGRIMALVATCVLAGIWEWGVLRDRAFDLDEAEQRVTALARAGEYQIEGSVRSIAALMEEASSRISPATGLEPNLKEWFSARLMNFPEVRNLSIVDSDGRVVALVTRPGQIEPTNMPVFSDSQYFRTAKALFPRSKFHLHEPVVSRVSNQASIPMSQSITSPNGGFRGLVVAEVDPSVFVNQLNSVVVDKEGGASLFRRDGIYYARVPQHEEYLGKTVAASPMFPLMDKGESGVVRFVSMVNSKEKISAYRTLANYPLVVAVAETMDQALARWHRKIIQEGVILSVLTVFLLILAWRYDARRQVSHALTRQLQQSHVELERQVAERTAHLLASNAELEQFAYLASHDLQEPLRSISGFLQLLSKRYQGRLDAEADEFIGFAVDGVQRMARQINDVLAYSRVGREQLEAEPCDADELARSAVQALSFAISTSNATVTIGALPKVSCRPSELQSVFQNLLGNAIKYRAPNRAPEISITAMPEGGGMVRFSVTDNGIGIEAQYHECIFGIFRRLHPRNRYEGTGIGLALCRKVVEHHGGRIWLTSEPDRGTTMMFTLKAA